MVKEIEHAGTASDAQTRDLSRETKAARHITARIALALLALVLFAPAVSASPLSDAPASYPVTYPERIRDKTVEWTFKAPADAASGLIVYLTVYSQSMTNYRQNGIDVSLAVNGDIKSNLSERYDSHTKTGWIPGVTFTLEAPDAVVKMGDTVTLTMTAFSGDYLNYIYGVKVLAK